MRRFATIVLRPVRAWFRWWEARVRGPYRVAAVVTGSAATAAVIHLGTNVGLPLSFLSSVLLWIGIAVVEERTDRQTEEVDPAFVTGLRERVEPVIATHGFVYRSATGGRLSRHDHTETVLFEAVSSTSVDDAVDPDHPHDCIDIWIVRDRMAGTLDVSVDGHALGRLVDIAGNDQLADRITRTEGTSSDVEALRRAFSLVLPLS